MEQEQKPIYEQITDWLSRQPKWFSYALHASAVGEATDQIVEAIAQKACQENGLEVPFGDDAPLPKEFTEEDLLSLKSSEKTIVLDSITANKGVNALADDAELKLERDGITVVYGENGSGKSGFSRLIRNSCTSRAGATELLPNVFKATGPSVATYRVLVNGEPSTYQWMSDKGGFPEYPEIMFFDSACALQEVEGRANEILYVPPVLSIFQRLSAIVSSVAETIKAYSGDFRINVSASTAPDYVKQSPQLAALVNCMDESTAKKQLEKLVLSEAELTRLEQLPIQMKSDPGTELPAVERKIKQLSELREKLLKLYKHCDPGFCTALDRAWEEKEKAQSAVVAAQKLISESSSLEGVGSEEWKALWWAAKAYSDNHAYKDESFPYTSAEARCPLCQQELLPDAKARLGEFERFMSGAAETTKRRKDADLKRLLDGLTSSVQSVVNEKGSVAIIENNAIRNEMDELVAYLERFDSSAQDRTSLMRLCESTKNAGLSVRKELDTLQEKVGALKEHLKPGFLEQLKSEHSTLQTRRWLTDNAELILVDVRARRTMELLEKTRKQCSTRGISSLVAELSKSEIVEKMSASFRHELDRLQANALPVVFGAKTQAGREVQEIALKQAVLKAKAASVFSEGERKIIAIAGFFAQVDVIQHSSTIVLDDPVTSLDHKWRETVAKRIVEEAALRPVVVFTHDPVFCSYLTRLTDGIPVNCEFRTVRRKGSLAGVVSDELDWSVCKNKDRIKALRAESQRIRANIKSSLYQDDAAQDRDIQACYGRLRAAWERAVEEVLLNGVIERMKPQVHTQQLRYIPDINDNDIEAVTDAMTRCSAIIEAHDDPLIALPNSPTIDELDADISALDSWAREIKKRRN